MLLYVVIEVSRGHSKMIFDRLLGIEDDGEEEGRSSGGR